MFLRLLWVCILGGYGLPVAASFPCFLTVVKDKCWDAYDVTVTIYDAITAEKIAQVVLAKDAVPWVRQKLLCTPGQKWGYAASFSPNIWESDKGVSFSGKQFVMLPTKLGPKQMAWEVSLCYPSAFTGVPFPPNVSGPCGCDFKSIPAISSLP